MSWNTAPLLDRCLAALPAALDDLDASITVVDNASTDGSADVAARHPHVSVVRNPGNIGYGAAMNQALADGNADILIALNPDTEPPPGSLATLAHRLWAAPDVGLMVPRLVYPDRRLQHSVYRFPSVRLAATVCFVPRRWQVGDLGSRWWLEGFAPHDQATDVDWAVGAVHVIRAAALGGLPPYRERWFMYVEDLDLCWRLARRGWRRRLEADVEVPHVGNAAGAQAWGADRTARWLAATYDWYALTHGPAAMRRWAAVNTAGVLAHLARAPDLRAVLPVHVRALRGSVSTVAPPPDTVPAAMESLVDPDIVRRRIAKHPFWYHTIDVAPGITTPGWFDLRRAVDRLPWPDVKGKRCLDIGTFDGFFAFELERRGAAEVVAIDIEDHTQWDWPPDSRPGPTDLDREAAFTGPPKGEGFRLLAELSGSAIEWRALSIYDLSPSEIGTFDVVVCGSLLLHLRDPLRALAAVASVCDGWFLSSEQVEPWLSVFGRGRPLFRLSGTGQACQWWLPNGAGHRQLLRAAGFEVTKVSKSYLAEFNAHPKPARTIRTLPTDVLLRALVGSWRQGVLHRALLARPGR